MRTFMILSVFIVLLASEQVLLSQDAPSDSNQPQSLSPKQQEALKRGTALFIITLILLLLVIVAAVVLSITLRRRVAGLARRKPPVPTESESLWWTAQGPNSPGADRKEK